MTATDWLAWHDPYTDEGSALSGRLRLVQDEIRRWLEARPGAAGLANVRVLEADASELASYAGSVPADLVLMAGVFGNISDADIRRTVEALPQLCAANATLIWTRTRRAPDLTPTVRGWLDAAGFAEQAFHAPDSVLQSCVGVNRFAGAPRPLAAAGRIFEFVA